MSNFEFSPLNVARLGLNATHAVAESIITLATPVRSELGAVCAAALDQLTASNTEMGQSINRSQKSALSDEVSVLDKDRDFDTNMIFKQTNNYLRSTDLVLKTASSTLQLFLAPYKGLASMPLDVQTRVTNEMLGKYKTSDELKAAAANLSLDKTFASLEIKNNKFASVYTSRTAEVATLPPAAPALKPAVNVAFAQFCNVLVQTVNLTPTDTAVALFNQIDALRKKYHALESGSNDKPDAATGTEPTK